MLNAAKQQTSCRIEAGRETGSMKEQNKVVLQYWHVVIWTKDTIFAWHCLWFSSKDSVPCFILTNDIMKMWHLLACFVSQIPGTWGHLWVWGPLRLCGSGTWFLSGCGVVPDYLWVWDRGCLRGSDTRRRILTTCWYGLETIPANNTRTQWGHVRMEANNRTFLSSCKYLKPSPSHILSQGFREDLDFIIYPFGWMVFWFIWGKKTALLCSPQESQNHRSHGLRVNWLGGRGVDGLQYLPISVV